MKNVIVTGGRGFVGSHLVDRLKEKQYDIIVIDDLSSGHIRKKKPGVCYYDTELGQFDFSVIKSKPHYFVHLGEYSRVEQSLFNYATVMRSNRNNFWKVLEYCKTNNVKLIYSASSTIFADKGKNKFESPYALSKYQNVELLKCYSDWYGLNYAISYFYNVYGPGEIEVGPNATVVAKFLRLKKQGDRFAEITYPGTQTRFFTHIEDIINALELIIEYGSGDMYGIGSDDKESIIGLAKMIGLEPKIVKARQGNRQEGKLVIGKTTELGWKPNRSLKEYIESKKLISN